MEPFKPFRINMPKPNPDKYFMYQGAKVRIDETLPNGVAKFENKAGHTLFDLNTGEQHKVIDIDKILGIDTDG